MRKIYLFSKILALAMLLGFSSISFVYADESTTINIAITVDGVEYVQKDVDVSDPASVGAAITAIQTTVETNGGDTNGVTTGVLEVVTAVAASANIAVVTVTVAGQEVSVVLDTSDSVAVQSVTSGFISLGVSSGSITTSLLNAGVSKVIAHYATTVASEAGTTNTSGIGGESGDDTTAEKYDSFTTTTKPATEPPVITVSSETNVSAPEVVLVAKMVEEEFAAGSTIEEAQKKALEAVQSGLKYASPN